MAKSRTGSSIRNAFFSFGGYIFTILLQFVNRTFFVHLLSAEYLGLNGLFSNILSVLALSELGIGTAMAFALYKPVAEHDTELIKSLMHLYKKMYTIIGSFVIVAGLILTPFLHVLIKDMPDIKYIRVYFLLYVLNAGVSYFYTYKRTLIICDQDAYISTSTQLLASIGTKIVQVIVLFWTKNYLLYLLVQVIFTISENMLISKIADRKYTYLKDKHIQPLPAEEKENIKVNVKAMLCHKIGTVVVNATDNLIISKILGLASVGSYANYTLVVDNISALTDKIIYSISASVGDLIATGDKEKAERMFYNILFVNYWVVSFCSICLVGLLQSFIQLWLGEEYLFSSFTVIILVLCFYFSRMRNTVNIYKEAAGIMRQDKYKALIESVVNLVVSIPLTYKLGVAGVRLGTLISTLLVPFWLEGYVLFKHFFGKSPVRYMAKQVGYLATSILVALVTGMLSMVIPGEGLINFAAKMVLYVLLPNILMGLLFFKTKEFEYLRSIFARVVKHNKSKGE